MLLIVLSFAAAPVLGTAVPFGSEQNIGDGAQLINAVVSGDIDRDGDADLVTTSQGDNTIAWYENTGDGFVRHVISQTAMGARAVFLVDLDRNGRLDVVTASFDDDTIAWYSNDGGDPPSWTQHVVSSSADGAVSVFAADIDADGDVDVLSASSNDNRITWHENVGGSPPTWIAQVLNSSAGGASSVMAVDVDRDGDMDVASTQSTDGTVVWYENNGAQPPVWTERTVATGLSGVADIAACDINGDGHADFISVAAGATQVNWHENDGSTPPSFETWSVAGVSGAVAAVVSADLDRDGDADILIAAFQANEITWFENDGADRPGWITHTMPTAVAGAASVATDDMDGDGDPDILFAARGANSVGWFANTTIHRIAVYPTEHTVDGDVFQADESRWFDMDKDGDLDVLAVGRNGDFLAWWENADGNGNRWTKHVIDDRLPEASGAWAADLDSDGDLDVIAGSANNGELNWYENLTSDGLQWEKKTIQSDFATPEAFEAADIDLDGDTDIVALIFAEGGHAIWAENLDGDGDAWSLHVIDNDFQGAYYIDLGDFDGDGDLDLVGAARQSDDIIWWANNGPDNAWTRHEIVVDTNLPASSVGVDFDHDGDLDVLATIFENNTVVWYENLNGLGTLWEEHLVSDSFDFTIHAIDADLDGDGDLDVVGTGHTFGEIAWFENIDGLGLTWVEHNIIIGFGFADFADAGDVNGDGRLDIVAAAATGNAIKWWDDQGGQFSLATLSTAPKTLTEYGSGDVLRVAVTHEGRAGDSDLELASLELRFESDAGIPFTDRLANAIVESISIHVDDGSGVFESTSDTLVTTVQELTVVDGVQTVTLPDGAETARVSFGEPGTFFVVLHLGSAAADQGIAGFQVTHMTMASGADDRNADIPLGQVFGANTITGVISIAHSAAGDVDGDGDVDLQDYDQFIACLTGPDGGIIPGCESADGDGDGDVDLGDFSILQLGFTGSL
ncbi:MAG: VCBS repeat-containing protein [Planctomycetes bacterium]|nr:VCBS repeat-containing protein [Planctomycetota bacterium]